MKKKLKYFTTIGILIGFVFIISQKDIIESSHKSGLYLKPFILNLKTKKENNIKYTLDGSSPISKSQTFQKELLITGKEYNDSLSYINTTIPDSIAKFGWRPPLGNQDKATILKYAAFQNEQQISDVKTLTFLIDSNIYENTKSTKNKLLNKLNNQILNSVFRTTKYQLPIISISTDKENLFDNQKGLFVSGDKLDPKNIHSGNYFERGKEYERKVHFQYFNEKGILDFELDLGMRIHGGITRRNPQKSLKFYARKEYGTEDVKFPFISENKINRFIVESMQESGGGQALIEDVVAQEIVKGLNIEQQKFQAVIVFINGEYWGLHNIREKIDENYLAYKFDLHKDSFDLIDGNPTLEYETIYGNNSDYIKMINFIKENNLNIDSNYKLIKEKIDIGNLIDYYSVEMFFANHDWPIHNIKIYRKNNEKWRFILYDLDGGFTNKRDHSFNMFERICNEEMYPHPEATFLFRSLMKNNQFRKRFELRYKEIITLYMQEERTIPLVDSISSIYKINMQDHINRWRYPWSLKHHWERDIEKNIKEFLRKRENETLKNLNELIKEY